MHSCLPWQRISTTHAILSSHNDGNANPLFYISSNNSATNGLTHWGRVTHIYVGNLTIIGSDNGLSPGRRQAIIWTKAGILLIGTLGTNFSEILIEIRIFSFTKMHLKMSSGKWRPSCLGLNVLILPSKANICPPNCLGRQWRNPSRGRDKVIGIELYWN